LILLLIMQWVNKSVDVHRAPFLGKIEEGVQHHDHYTHYKLSVLFKPITLGETKVDSENFSKVPITLRSVYL